jgi:hypothetical protein
MAPIMASNRTARNVPADETDPTAFAIIVLTNMFSLYLSLSRSLSFSLSLSLSLFLSLSISLLYELEETYPKNIIIGEENGENKKEAKSRENQKGWKISEKPT